MKKLLICVLVFTAFGAGCVPKTPSPTEIPTANEETNQAASSKRVDRSSEGLTSFPASILKQTAIEELDISGNQLTGALPAEIRFLTGLRVLNASRNAFTGIPAEIGQLSELEVLDFSYNQLTGLPHELGNLSMLKVLDLTGNDVSQADLEVITQSLPATVEIRR